jgi:predicted AAA+ superfamily ATPase
LPLLGGDHLFVSSVTFVPNENFSYILRSVSLSAPTVQRYVDLMVDLLLVRTLRPWSGSIKKRYIKSPKVYVRDTGLVHALLQIKSMEDLLSNLIMGNSYEAFVIEHILNLVPDPKNACFYRTVSGAEIDLIIELDSKKRLAFEIKHSSSPQVSKGFYVGCEDVQATHRYVVYPVQ